MNIRIYVNVFLYVLLKFHFKFIQCWLSRSLFFCNVLFLSFQPSLLFDFFEIGVATRKVAVLAEAFGVVRVVRVLTSESLLAIAEFVVTRLAHELGTMLLVEVLAEELLGQGCH